VSEVFFVYTGVGSNLRERGNSATIGMTSGGTVAIQSSFEQPLVADGMGVRFVENRFPIADAGANKTVDSGKAFTLDASGTVDPDGQVPLTFRWRQVSGPATVITDADKAKATVSGTGGPNTLAYEVSVRDQFGMQDTDQVTITVKAPK
jgi:chitinase